jgi:hypothetical protein
MLLPPKVSKTVTALKDCPITQICSSSDVKDSHHHVPNVVVEMNAKLPNLTSCNNWSSKLFHNQLKSYTTGQGSNRGLEQVLLTELELQRSTVEEGNNRLIEPVDEVPKSWVLKSRLQRILKPSFLLRSFVCKKSTKAQLSNNHSSHPQLQNSCQNTGLTTEESLTRNFYHSRKLMELIQANSGNRMISVASVHWMLQADDGTWVLGTADVAHMFWDDKVSHPSDHRKYLSSFLSYNKGDLDNENESNKLGIGPNPLKTVIDSFALLGSLGNTSLSDKLAYVKECFLTQVSMLDQKIWNCIQKFNKMDLIMGKHLGKGSFSDVFEVLTMVVMEVTPTLESLGSDRANLDKLMKAKFSTKK